MDIEMKGKKLFILHFMKKTRPEKPFLKGCAGKTKQKTTKKIAKDYKRFQKIDKDLKGCKRLQKIEKYCRRLQ